MQEQYLNYRSAAELLGVSVETLKAWVRAGQVPVHRHPGGKAVYILGSELAATVASW